MNINVEIPLIVGEELEEFLCIHLFKWIKKTPSRYISSPANNYCWVNSHGRHMHDATVFTSPTVSGFQWVVSEMSAQGWKFSCTHVKDSNLNSGHPGKFKVLFERYDGTRTIGGHAENEDMGPAVCRAAQIALILQEKQIIHPNLTLELSFVEPSKKVLT